MKTKEELNVLKAEVEKLNKKLAELTDEELAQVTGDMMPDIAAVNERDKQMINVENPLTVNPSAETIE